MAPSWQSRGPGIGAATHQRPDCELLPVDGVARPLNRSELLLERVESPDRVVRSAVVGAFADDALTGRGSRRAWPCHGGTRGGCPAPRGKIQGQQVVRIDLAEIENVAADKHPRFVVIPVCSASLSISTVATSRIVVLLATSQPSSKSFSVSRYSFDS